MVYQVRCPSRIPRISGTEVKSARKGIKSVSSASWGSLNQDETGTALLGWKMYEAGELSKMMVSAIGRPSWERSCRKEIEKPSSPYCQQTDLDIIALVVVAAFTEEAVGNNFMDVQLVKNWVGILKGCQYVNSRKVGMIVTLLRLAVKMTTSYSSPILFIKLSTPGLLRT